jgi:hypothetical protein
MSETQRTTPATFAEWEHMLNLLAHAKKYLAEVATMLKPAEDLYTLSKEADRLDGDVDILETRIRRARDRYRAIDSAGCSTF